MAARAIATIERIARDTIADIIFVEADGIGDSFVSDRFVAIQAYDPLTALLLLVVKCVATFVAPSTPWSRARYEEKH